MSTPHRIVTVPSLAEPVGFAHAVVSSPGRTVHLGGQTAPRRVMLYGTQGIGKTTFGAMAPRPIFIQTEDGLAGIECDRENLELHAQARHSQSLLRNPRRTAPGFVPHV